MIVLGMFSLLTVATVMVIITDVKLNREYKKNNPDWKLEKIPLKQQIKDTLGG